MFDIVKQIYGKGNTKTARFEGANFKTGPNHKTLGHRSYVMATPSITDLQSLVNRLTADNNRLRNLVKLYEATFAAMKPGKYYVCSDDGEVSSSYWKSGAAEQFASELAADGTGATVVLVTRRYEAEPAPREDFGVLPGVDYPATTSLEVAKIFGKRHDNVVRDIRSIIDNCPKRFTALNFEASNYLDNTGRSLPMFIIFKDGFTLLVMGYTGPEAMRFKLAYIEAFNALETELQRQREGALPPADALAPSQQAQLKALVDAKVGMLPKEHQRKGYGEVWSRFARHFEIAKYTQLPPERMSEAVEYLIGLELKVAEPALPDMRSLPRFASYDRYAASIEAAYTILSRLNMHDVQFSQARLGTHPLRGADCSRFYNAVMREVQISAAMVDAARNALNNALELRQIAETVW